ncbi:MAG: DNA polymerase IV, partial [Bacteroidota bacterium]
IFIFSKEKDSLKESPSKGILRTYKKLHLKMFQKSILHLDLDAFFVSVECLKNSQLKGKPLIVGGSSGRGVVAACSYEARKFGIRSAMPMKMALRLCPDVLILKGDYDHYLSYSKLVTEVIAEDAPVFEKASIDEFYLDLTGMDRHIGCWKWSKALRQRIIRETGLPISFGLSVNKTVSKIGTNEAKPNGAKLVENGREKQFIAPLSIKKIPGLGDKTFRKLAVMGVRKIHTLSAIPPRLLQREFGQSGLSLWKKANAIDHSPVVPYSERKSISTERTFQVDTIDLTLLKGQLTKMVLKLAFELRAKQKLTACVTIKIRYTDFNTHTLQQKIPYTASDKILKGHAQRLFTKLYQRRQLIRLLGVKFSHLVTGNYQTQLFEDTPEEVNLLGAMDHIRKRFGAGAITLGNTIG